MSNNRPPYIALDAHGMEYARQARTIGELPLEQRQSALQEAAQTVSDLVGLQAKGTLSFGSPVFTAFQGLTRNRAKVHPKAGLLLTQGSDLSLDLCKTYA